MSNDGLTLNQLAERNAVLVTEVEKLRAERDQLAAENVALKAGASYFSYGSEHNFEWHKTAEEAVEAAEAAIDDYRGEACDGWSEEVDSICWGIIMQSSTKVGERPRNEDDCCDPAIDTVCDYALLPNIETPATDRIYAGIKAEAKSHDLNAFISHYSAELDAHIESGGDQFDAKSVRLRSFIVGGRMFREKLRDEEKALALREVAK
ncbi:hypothetical protein AI2943V1_3552 [Klebsiella oxytoca]|uniref:hypothetical protein n=1 Tax=Klebsiella grimontii TaxID=2058152 RepID=UPI001DB974EF|nr:hypothetical protein [Klebsiella grimontii]CAF2879116.1 hypothetical protein AI2943V1_3061 [Klebsiella oxytoca]CAF9446629.1 hypothetical protein AI2903V1_3361 [Klebsiella pneumoniae]CAF2887890.1 hypothetical protein AI2943V1_3552 [Klebsiella oxytoca]CAH5717347.1 hypothetical protein AI2943V1_3061 [Klebsiella oxytoca]CAH5735008.1 hypothetical protein AI2943V1_3552 [Klebsiella oxytoca]